MKQIYVGNLPFSTTETELRQLFAPYGRVHSVQLITDRMTGRPRGFGFVELDDDAVARAVAELNGVELGGNSLRINETGSLAES
jgi:RNA recognition motif-containing protein